MSEEVERLLTELSECRGAYAQLKEEHRLLCEAIKSEYLWRQSSGADGASSWDDIIDLVPGLGKGSPAR